MGARLIGGLPRVLRHPIRIEERGPPSGGVSSGGRADFLDLVRWGVYENPGSPYHDLLRLAGCEFGDLERLVARARPRGGAGATLRARRLSDGRRAQGSTRRHPGPDVDPCRPRASVQSAARASPPVPDQRKSRRPEPGTDQSPRDRRPGCRSRAGPGRSPGARLALGLLGGARRERARPGAGVRGRRHLGQPLVLSHRPAGARTSPALSLERPRPPARPRSWPPRSRCRPRAT